MAVKRVLGSVFKWTGKSISFVRVAVLNLVFVLSVVLIIVSIQNIQTPSVPESAVLWLNPTGTVVEQYSFNDPLMKFLSPEQVAVETSLSDITTALRIAAKDERIKAVVIDPDKISGIGLSSINSIHQALGEVKAAGKPVYAYSRGMRQHQYLLTSTADQVVLHPMGYVAISGYGAYREYFKSALDKLKLDVHIFRVGEFKSAMEPYLRDDMSDEAKVANQAWLNDLWHHYTHTVAANRELDPADIEDYTNNIVDLMAAANGDAAKVAEQAELVDGLGTGEMFWDYVKEQVPAIADVKKPAVGLNTYLAAHLQFVVPNEEPAVGVVTVEGTIIDGEAPPGSAAGDSVADLLRSAKENSRVKAVVLRVNSPGGSAFASEIIREQVLALKAAGKPVVVSMGNVAASGGYWVSAEADEIWASPTTITGSIGIFAAIPNAHRALRELGVSSDGVGTTAVSGGVSVTRPLNPVVKESLQLAIEGGYQRFTSIVAQGRQLDSEQVDKAAGGRVWSGARALELGLVDQLGELEDAIESAAYLASIEGEPEVLTIEDPKWAQLGLMQRLFNIMAASSEQAFPALAKAERWLQANMPVWIMYPDRKNMYSHCMECAVVSE